MSGAEYSDVSYWNQRYAVDMEPFEFYQQPAALRSFILPLVLLKRSQHSHQQQSTANAINGNLLPPAQQQSADTAAHPQPLTSSPFADSGHRKAAGGLAHDGSSGRHLPAPFSAGDSRLRVLVLGCGSSELSLEVWRMLAGAGEVLSIDFSVNCVEEMQRRHADKPGMTFSVCDVRRLPYPSEHFDLILDKGCLDCLHCSDSAAVRDEVKAAVSGLQRCLRLKGTLLSLSHSPPEQRSACFLLDRTEMLLDLLQRERQDKESRKAMREADGSCEGSAAAPQRSASAASSGRRFARASVSSRLSRPLAGFSQPVVLRLDKQRLPSPVPRRSSVSSRGSVRLSVSSNAADVLSEQAEAEAETLSAASAAADVDVQLNLSAVEEAEHYLYVCTKDTLPNCEQGGGRQPAPGLARRSSMPENSSLRSRYIQ